MIVLKLGGSLLLQPELLHWLTAATQSVRHKIIIVPGGGLFADQVRHTQKHWAYDDRTAHIMAILAMQQMAYLFKGLCADLYVACHIHALRDVLVTAQAVIWKPNLDELDKAGIPASWDISSDSLAAWLSMELSAQRLILVKSAAVEPFKGVVELAAQGIVDKAFVSYARQCSFPIECLHYSKVATFAERLQH